MNLAQQIQIIIEQLPTTEQKLIFELIKRINSDDILTHEDINDIEEARAEYIRGESILFDDIDW